MDQQLSKPEMLDSLRGLLTDVFKLRREGAHLRLAQRRSTARDHLVGRRHAAANAIRRVQLDHGLT